MIYPIVAYGDPVLRQTTQEINKENPQTDLQKLIEDMYETMYSASGVGLAAPQVGLALRLFVIDSTRMTEDGTGLKQVFLNPTIVEELGEEWAFEEGCLSIPNIRENVSRQEKIKIHYFDENWNEFEKEFDEITARVIQHEYDHIEGILFTDHISALKKRLLKAKLTRISKGRVKADYRMRFPS
jgi:peptide deformylase